MDNVITKKQWNNYIGILRKINDKASNEVLLWMKYNGGDGLLNTAIRDSNGNNLIDISYMVAQKYGNASASVAVEMCQAMAELSEMITPAELAELPTYSEVAKTVNGVLKTSQNREEISSAVGRLVKKTGMQTTLKMAKTYKAQFAWIPSGETCPYCMMLASRGWEYGGNINMVGELHLHANCDCNYAVRYDNTEVEGYDPDKLYDEWHDAYVDAGKNTTDALNLMRREDYAKNKKIISKQKASAEKKREELNSSMAEEQYV